MAETIEGLYLRIGLKYDGLNQDFVAISETLQSNIQRLNRQNTLINLQAKLDLTGVTDAEQKLKIEQDKLNKQIEVAQQKLKLYESNWIGAVKANGAASQQAEKAAIAFKQQQLVLAQLSQKLKEVNAQQKALPKENSLLASYNGLKGNIAGEVGKLTDFFGGLNEASTSAGGALSKTIEIIGGIPSPVGKAVAALASFPLVAKGIENSLLDLATPAIETGDAFYVLSRGLQMSIADTSQLSTVCKVTGIEISEITTTMKRLNMQITRGGEEGNATVRALKKFGVETRNAKGELKNAYEMSIALADGLKRAQEAGRGKEFIASILGRNATGDMVTYLEDLEGNIELANSLVKNGLADPALAHQVQGNINAMNTQAGFLGSAFSSALLPVADKIVPNITERFKALTRVVADNADNIKHIGYALGEVVDGIGKVTAATVELAAASGRLMSDDRIAAYDLFDKYKDNKDVRDDAVIADFKQKKKDAEKAKADYEKAEYDAKNAKRKSQKAEAEKVLEAAKQELEKAEKAAEEARIKARTGQSMEQKIRAKELADMTAAERAKIDYGGIQFASKFEYQINKVSKSLRELDEQTIKNAKSTKEFNDNFNEENVKRLEKYADEISKIKLDLKFGDDTHGKALAELSSWYRQALQEAEGFEDSRAKISELYGLKRQQIEEQFRKETTDNVKNLMQEAANIEYEMTHSAFEKQLRDIEQWKQAQTEKAKTFNEVAAIAANAAIKETQAFEREFDRIKGKTQSLAEKIFEQEHSQKDRDIMKAQKERAEMLKEGIYPQKWIDRWYENELAKISADARKNRDYRRAPKLDYSLSFIPDVDFYGNIQADVEKHAPKLNTSTIDIGNINTLTDSAGKAATALAQIPQATKDFIGKMKFNEPLGTMQNSGAQKAMAQLPQPAIDRQDISAKIKDAAQKLIQGKEAVALSQNLAVDLSPITNELVTLTQTVGGIAQDIQAFQQSKQSPVVNVNPTINIDLGGAYVFDNAMKAELTDDITNNVANGITEAITKAANDSKFGFNN